MRNARRSLLLLMLCWLLVAAATSPVTDGRGPAIARAL
jgi:hypothetical protein